MFRKNKKEIVKLGVLEGTDCDHLKWKSKNKAMSWNFAYYMPVLMRDALREMASNLHSCPSWLAEEFDDDVDAACVEWSKILNKIADKFDYASRICNTLDFLSKEDQMKLDEYYSKDHYVDYKENKDGSVQYSLEPIPDYIEEIHKKEDVIAEDMQNKLKEALQELGEIWYDIWD